MWQGIVNNDFWFGFMVFVLPFIVVGLWGAGREKLAKVWEAGYSAGQADYIEYSERHADYAYDSWRESQGE